VVEAIGELYHRYERGPENQLGALGLVLDCAKDDRLARCVVEDGWPPARAAERMSLESFWKKSGRGVGSGLWCSWQG
jgi:hypothetical protein